MTTDVPVVVRAHQNESAFPPTTDVVAAVTACSTSVHRYPAFAADGTRRAIAGHLGVADDQVTVGPGATAVIAAILSDAAVRARRTGLRRPVVVTPAPTFDGFAIICRTLDLDLRTTPLTAQGAPDLDAVGAAITEDTIAVIVCSPHNPTGAVVSEPALCQLLARLPAGVPVVLDEAYVEYCPAPPDSRALVAGFGDLVVLRTFSKAYGLAGLRAGYAFGSAAAIAGPRSRELPFALTAAAEAAIPAVLDDQAALAERVTATRHERTRLTLALRGLGIRVLASEANFVFLPQTDGCVVGERLRAGGIVGKQCGDAGFRLTVTDPVTTDRIVSLLSP